MIVEQPSVRPSDLLGHAMSDHPQSQVGWLGTGRMGSVLVRRLLAAGLDVAVYNRTKARAEPLAADGAKVVDQAADLARLRGWSSSWWAPRRI